MLSPPRQADIIAHVVSRPLTRNLIGRQKSTVAFAYYSSILSSLLCGGEVSQPHRTLCGKSLQWMHSVQVPIASPQLFYCISRKNAKAQSTPRTGVPFAPSRPYGRWTLPYCHSVTLSAVHKAEQGVSVGRRCRRGMRSSLTWDTAPSARRFRSVNEWENELTNGAPCLAPFIRSSVFYSFPKSSMRSRLRDPCQIRRTRTHGPSSDSSSMSKMM